ncbi:MAG: metallophosphoesterase [Anaerolineae bacterium]|nr:metallophosphoesterase [Anaerolineae bacterium]
MSISYPNRVVSIPAGVVMVVTDLHSDWPMYQRYRDVFLGLHAQGLAHTLLFTGDVIHNENLPEDDRSIEIVTDILKLRDELGDALVMLLGNHELAHIYPFVLSKGSHVYTTEFEHAMGQRRKAIVDFFDGLPFYARTPAGVTLCHAGAFSQARDPVAMAQVLAFSHRDLLQAGATRIPQEHLTEFFEAFDAAQSIPYEQLVRTFFGVTGPEDPRFYDYLIAQLAMQQPAFDLLWEVLFNRNELDYGEVKYSGYVLDLLRALSRDYAPQRVLVTGHIRCANGYHIVAGNQQLRLASATHARPFQSARYLLFDAAKPVDNAEDLLPGLGSVFANLLEN